MIAGLWVGVALARPALLPQSTVVTDTRASVVGLDVSRLGSSEARGGHLSYLTTFTSTSSRVTANFGVHYASFDDRLDGRLRGLAASSMTVFSRSLAGRFDNGVPRAQLLIAPGLVPSALVGRRSVQVDLPGVVRVGAVLSPAPWFSLVPWVEGGAAVSFRGTASDALFDVQVGDDPPQVDELLDYHLAGHGLGRAGLVADVHLGRLGLRVHTGVSLPTGERLAWSSEVGASLLLRWDRVVPSVLADEPCVCPPTSALPVEDPAPGPIEDPVPEPTAAPEPAMDPAASGAP